jgi:hypothetical protein
MPFDSATITTLMRDSVATPRRAAARVLAQSGGYTLAFLAVALMAVLSALASVMLSWIVPPTGNAELDHLMAQPLRLAGLQALGMILFGMAITFIGRVFGGIGRLDQTLVMLAWIDFLMLVLQLGLILLLLAFPVFGGLAFIAGIGLIGWVLASFIAELHGFSSTASTLAALVGLVVLLAVVLVLLTTSI